MARIARMVVSGIPRHVTQRGNRRERTLFGDSDDRLDRDPLGIAAAKAGAQIRAYCLMPNHGHAVVTAKDEEGLWRSFSRFASAHHRSHRCAQPLDLISLAGAVRLGGYG
jgi:putative transposase